MAERQRDRETESQRDGATETERQRDTDRDREREIYNIIYVHRRERAKERGSDIYIDTKVHIYIHGKEPNKLSTLGFWRVEPTRVWTIR